MLGPNRGSTSTPLTPSINPAINIVEKGKDMELTEDDVLHILKLIDESKFDYFQLEVGELKITVSKGEPIPLASSSGNARVAPSPAPGVGEPSKATPVSPAPATRSPAPNVDAKAAAAEGLVPITAPLLGTFYVAPEPGAPPFVQVGAAITEDTTVGLIEVMKVFNSVRASVKGTISQVVAQNGQFVEYGQTLFLVKP
jgi:acetyl-CoA carboxylase biotin carboxyl carrier protein